MTPGRQSLGPGGLSTRIQSIGVEQAYDWAARGEENCQPRVHSLEQLVQTEYKTTGLERISSKMRSEYDITPMWL